MGILSGPDGQIYDANNKFLEWIGYTFYEFTREEDPVTWVKISEEDDSLSADKHEAIRCYQGHTREYRTRKYYKPKGKPSSLVELHVRRFPEEGGVTEFRFFIVEVVELVNGTRKFAEEMLDVNKRFADEIGSLKDHFDRENSIRTEISSSLKDGSLERKELKSVLEEIRDKPTTYERFATFVEKHPKLMYPLLFVLGMGILHSLFGDMVVQLFHIWVGADQ